MNLLELIKTIQTSMENIALAAVRSLKANRYQVDIGEKRFEVSNFPKTQQVEGRVTVLNQQDLEKQLTAVNGWLKQVDERLQTLKPLETIKVANFPEVKIPEFPKAIRLSDPIDVSAKSLKAVLEALGDLTALVSKLPKEYPKVEIPPFPKLEIPPFPKIPEPLKTISVDNLEKLVSDDPKKYVPVRLSDGQRFYQALEELSVASGRSQAFSDSQGVKQQALVDGDRHVQVDVLTAPSVDIDTSSLATSSKQDEIISAIEDKVIPLVDISDLATSAKQDTGNTSLASIEANTTLAKFSTNDIAQPSTTLTYIGKEDSGGVWLVVKFDTTSGVAKTYATITNNPATTTYSSAWTNRATLTYGTFSTAF